MFDSHNVMKPSIPQLDTVALVHFRFKQRLLAGVENVMHVQKKLLEHAGRKAWFLVGETDLETDCVVYEPIRMYGNQRGWEDWQQTSIDGRMIKCITAALSELTQDSAVIFHNTTNAAVYNPPFGIAAAKIVNQSIRGERPPAVLWAHDASASPLQLRRLLPDEEDARIAVISGVTRDKIQRAMASMRRQGLAVPNYDVRIIPNAIDAQFFESTLQTPQILAELAPQCWVIGIFGEHERAFYPPHLGSTRNGPAGGSSDTCYPSIPLQLPGTSANSPEPLLRTSPAMGHDAEILEV